VARIFEWWWGLIRFGFRLLYNEMAFTYDGVSRFVSLGAWRCWQRTSLKHLDFPPGQGIVLELAHGTGNLQLDLKAAGYETVGCDLSPYMGRIARRKVLKTYAFVALIRGIAQKLPFADRQFNAVISTFPTDFIFVPDTLHEVHRVLQENGIFIVVPNGSLLGGGLIRGFLEWLYRITGQREGEQDGIMDHVLRFFHEHGFEAEVHYEPCIRNTVATVIVARKRV